MSNVLNMVSEESFIAQTEKIVKAITGESGTPFTLLTDVTGTNPITVAANGDVTFSYEGTPPENINIAIVSINTYSKDNGVDSNNISYTFKSIDTQNKTITFHTDGNFDGRLTVEREAFASCVFVGEGIVTPIALCYNSFINLPVNYDVQLVQPKGADQEVTIDGTQESRIDLTDINGVNCIAPNSVTPSINVLQGPWETLAFAYLFDSTTNAYNMVEFDIEGTEVVIPANTFTENENVLTIALYDTTSGTARTVSEIDLSIHL